MASTQDSSLFKLPPELRNRIWNECAVNGAWLNLMKCSRKIKNELAPMCSLPTGPIDRMEFIIYAGEKSKRLGDVRVTWTKKKTTLDGIQESEKIALGLSITAPNLGSSKRHLLFAHLDRIPFLNEISIRVMGVGPAASARERMLAYAASNSKFRSVLTVIEDGKWDIAWGLSSRPIILENGTLATQAPSRSAQIDTAQILSDKYDDFPWDRALQGASELRWINSRQQAKWKRHHLLAGYTVTCCWDLPVE
jgi:hypothetical protein